MLEVLRHPALGRGHLAMTDPAEPTIRIQFDRETFKPTGIFYDNAETDVEQARLQKIANVMLKALADQSTIPLEDREP